jgi:hypothetical protein
MFRRLCAKIVQLGEQWQKEYADFPRPAEVRQSTSMERMFGDCAPAVVAFKIDNGYVVRTVQTSPEYDRVASGFVYCKDHQAIADHIVSEAAREKVMPNYAQGHIGNAKIGQVNTAPLPYIKRS